MRSPPDTSAESNGPPQPSETTALDERLAYLEIDESDRARLRELAPRLKVRAAAFVEAFYRHLFAFDETARFLQDPALVARLKQAQQAHLESMLEAEWDDDYVNRRHRVGDAHAQVGISPTIFLGAYNQYLQFCLRELSAHLEGPALDCAQQMLSLQKAVFLDVGLTLEAYFKQATSNLRRALDLVYQANAELRQFAQFTSHDLKTPLATMANLCDEALDEFRDSMPAEAAKLIESARQRAFRMSATIDELLHSSMSLHSDAPRDVVDSGQAMGEAIDQIRPLLEQKKIELTVPDRLPRVLGDKARIREIFYNLLSNAVKFSDKRRGRIVVGCANRDDDCIFSIADNGPGIPAEELSRVFVPFRRLPNHRDIPGSGLGLYFAKTMAEQQNGRIWVESEISAGSRFFVLLKRAPDEG
ncbi:MAG: protoglobin domain-containing protein [Pirellulales bacterium]